MCISIKKSLVVKYGIISIIINLCLCATAFSKVSNYVNLFDYKNINRNTFIPIAGFDDQQNHHFTLLKHAFEIQKIVASKNDTSFTWNGLKGIKTIYTKDSLILFFVRPNDNIIRPCILLTHGNMMKYRTSWSEWMKFYATDLAMRGFCVIYYENPSSAESSYKSANLYTRNMFYNGFQSAVAANMYAVNNASLLHIDTSKLIAGGLSFGAFCSLSMASADEGYNYTDPIFNAQGGYGAKSIYNNGYAKSIKYTYSIGGGLFKDDTTEMYNSHMGTFLNNNDARLNILFLHGRTDNLISFDQTKFLGKDSTENYFFAEGPRALLNNIAKDSININTKLIVNCTGGHSFLNSVCGVYYNCLGQYQWLYMSEPADTLTANSSYFTAGIKDTLWHYFTYMMSQIEDVNAYVSDFVLPLTSQQNTTFYRSLYFIQPSDTFTYQNPTGYYVIKNIDCEGDTIIYNDTTITSLHNENIVNNDDIKIYPNPTQHTLTVVANEMIEKIELYSTISKLINSFSVKAKQTQLSVNHLSNGNYFLSIQLKHKTIYKKISIQR